MRNYGKEQNKCLLNNKQRKENGIRLAIHYINHKVQQKDMHWTRTLKVQGREVDKENREKKKRMGTAEDRINLERSKTNRFG
jgi:uncharacterized protein YeaC (DUF1315 family)